MKRLEKWSLYTKDLQFGKDFEVFKDDFFKGTYGESWERIVRWYPARWVLGRELLGSYQIGVDINDSWHLISRFFCFANVFVPIGIGNSKMAGIQREIRGWAFWSFGIFIYISSIFFTFFFYVGDDVTTLSSFRMVWLLQWVFVCITNVCRKWRWNLKHVFCSVTWRFLFWKCP